MKACRPRGQVFLAQNKLMEADGEFSIALDLAQRVGNPTQLWKTYVALGDLRQVQGREDDAHRVYRDALSVIADVAAGLTDEPLVNTFVNSSHVQAILKKAKKESVL